MHLFETASITIAKVLQFTNNWIISGQTKHNFGRNTETETSTTQKAETQISDETLFPAEILCFGQNIYDFDTSWGWIQN